MNSLSSLPQQTESEEILNLAEHRFSKRQERRPPVPIRSMSVKLLGEVITSCVTADNQLPGSKTNGIIGRLGYFLREFSPNRISSRANLAASQQRGDEDANVHALRFVNPGLCRSLCSYVENIHNKPLDQRKSYADSEGQRLYLQIEEVIDSSNLSKWRKKHFKEISQAALFVGMPINEEDAYLKAVELVHDLQKESVVQTTAYADHLGAKQVANFSHFYSNASRVALAAINPLINLTVGSVAGAAARLFGESAINKAKTNDHQREKTKQITEQALELIMGGDIDTRLEPKSLTDAKTFIAQDNRDEALRAVYQFVTNLESLHTFLKLTGEKLDAAGTLAVKEVHQSLNQTCQELGLSPSRSATTMIAVCEDLEDQIEASLTQPAAISEREPQISNVLNALHLEREQVPSRSNLNKGLSFAGSVADSAVSGLMVNFGIGVFVSSLTIPSEAAIRVENGFMQIAKYMDDAIRPQVESFLNPLGIEPLKPITEVITQGTTAFTVGLEKFCASFKGGFDSILENLQTTGSLDFEKISKSFTGGFDSIWDNLKTDFKNISEDGWGTRVFDFTKFAAGRVGTQAVALFLIAATLRPDSGPEAKGKKPSPKSPSSSGSGASAPDGGGAEIELVQPTTSTPDPLKEFKVPFNPQPQQQPEYSTLAGQNLETSGNNSSTATNFTNTTPQTSQPGGENKAQELMNRYKLSPDRVRYMGEQAYFVWPEGDSVVLSPNNGSDIPPYIKFKAELWNRLEQLELPSGGKLPNPEHTKGIIPALLKSAIAGEEPKDVSSPLEKILSLKEKEAQSGKEV